MIYVWDLSMWLDAFVTNQGLVRAGCSQSPTCIWGMRICISEKSAKDPEPQISSHRLVFSGETMCAFGDITMPGHVALTKTVLGAIVRTVHRACLTIKLAPQQHKRNTSFCWYVTITAVREDSGSMSQGASHPMWQRLQHSVKFRPLLLRFHRNSSSHFYRCYLTDPKQN